MSARGYVFYQGPSMINGEPVVAIAITHSSNNEKTGDMVQTYIFVDNGHTPMENAYACNDVPVCGDCKHRIGTGGACYVNLGKGVTRVWESYVAGKYPHSVLRPMLECSDRPVRLGAYGDPAAVPVYVWKMLLTWASGHTGYTHQWKLGDDALMKLCMASVDSEEELVKARGMGYRTFRVRREDEPLQPREFACPASGEELSRLTCTQCMACDGGAQPKASAAVIVHGPFARRFYERQR